MPRFSFLLAFFLFASTATAQAPADLVDAYLAATALPAQVEQIGGQMVQQIQGQAAQFPEPAREPFRAIYADALGADALTMRLKEYVATNGEAEPLRAVVAMHEDPLVARMHDIEQNASESDQAQVALQMYAMTGSFTDYTATPERETQIARYLDATGSATSTVDLYLDIIVASAEAMSALRDEDDRPSTDSIRAQMRPQLEGLLGNMVKGGSLYTFREVSDEEFDAYIEQIASPTGQYAVALNAAALRAALVGAIHDAGDRFVTTLQKLDAAGEIDLDAMRAEAEARRKQQEMMQQTAPMEDEAMEEKEMVEDDQ